MQVRIDSRNAKFIRVKVREYICFNKRRKSAAAFVNELIRMALVCEDGVEIPIKMKPRHD